MRPTAANAALRPRQIAARSSAEPAMCSRVQPCRSQIARTAVDLLVERLAGGEPAAGPGGEERVAEFELLVRESTG